MKRCTLIVLLSVSVTVSAAGTDTLRYSLAMCHEMALANSSTAKIQAEAQKAASFRRRAAGAAMGPHLPTVKIEVQHFPRPPSSLERSGKDEGGRGKSRGVTSNTKKEKGDRCLPKKD